MKKLICALLVSMLSIFLLCSATAEPVTYTDKDVQLNLSGMSGTVVYSMIYNITNDPSNFLGKVIRLAGYYSVWQDPDTGMVYHYCVIPDATACCAQGMEFVWAGEHRYPNDYPMLGTDMILTGRLEEYMEDGYMYLHLVDAEVKWLLNDQ